MSEKSSASLLPPPNCSAGRSKRPARVTSCLLSLLLRRQGAAGRRQRPRLMQRRTCKGGQHLSRPGRRQRPAARAWAERWATAWKTATPRPRCSLQAPLLAWHSTRTWHRWSVCSLSTYPNRSCIARSAVCRATPLLLQGLSNTWLPKISVSGLPCCGAATKSVWLCYPGLLPAVNAGLRLSAGACGMGSVPMPVVLHMAQGVTGAGACMSPRSRRVCRDAGQPGAWTLTPNPLSPSPASRGCRSAASSRSRHAGCRACGTSWAAWRSWWCCT